MPSPYTGGDVPENMGNATVTTFCTSSNGTKNERIVVVPGGRNTANKKQKKTKNPTKKKEIHTTA